MLAVRQLKSSGDEAEFGGDQFLDFSDGNLLDCIDLEELFAGMADDGGDGGILPGLEMFDPEIMAEFAVSGGEESDANAMPSLEEKTDDVDSKELSSETDSTGVKVVGGEESDSGGRKSSAQSKKKLKKNHQGDKRKLKVDWTPELHRRFVQAVEQLGLDKAVPSKILEIMAVDGLTRHNIASHLQKYRSQRKHVLAREAEAASWSQRRQMYGTAVAGKRVLAGPWLSGPPTMGFPPMAPPPPPPPMHHQFPRPLHVWGHPSLDRQWPKHMAHSPAPPMGPPLWPVPPPCLPPSNPSSYWQPQPHHPQVAATSVTHGTPCYPPPPTVYNEELSKGLLTNRSGPQLQSFDFHPSKESVDAAIEDALTKPWQPLPLGLRAPSVDSVLTELHRQGIPKVPPTSPA